MSAEGFPAGTLISVWKLEWNAYHFGFVGMTKSKTEVLAYFHENVPKEFVEMQVGNSDWKRCPIEDYEFVKKTLDGLSDVRMRPCQ